MRFDKILIVRLSALGDVINTLPVLAVLRQHLPRSFIAWVVEDKHASLLEDHPFLDRLFVLERKYWANALRSGKIISIPTVVLNFIRSLRKLKFDIALDLQGNLRSGLITRLSGAPVRIGFARELVKEFSHLFTNHQVH